MKRDVLRETSFQSSVDGRNERGDGKWVAAHARFGPERSCQSRTRT